MKLRKTRIYAYEEAIDVYITRSIFNTMWGAPWIRRPTVTHIWYSVYGAKKMLRGNLKMYYKRNPHWLRGDES